MRRLTLALVLSGLLVLGYLLAAGGTALSWSDGNAGASGAIPDHLRDCSPGLNSHVVSNLQPNTKYAFQAIGKFASGEPREDLGQVLTFTTPATSDASAAKDDQVVSLMAAHVGDRSMTLYGGYSTGTINQDELEKFVVAYVPGDHTTVANLRSLGGASTTVPQGPLSTILSTTIGGLEPGAQYTFQFIGQRVSKGAWERLSKPVTFIMEPAQIERIETTPATPSTSNPSRDWTLQMLSSSPALGGTTLSEWVVVYNLASRVPEGTADLRDTSSPTTVSKGKPHSGFKYCKVRVSGCGGCHGDFEAMMHQQASEAPPIDRLSGEIRINGRADTWEYEPGKQYVIDIYVKYNHERWDREPGKFNKATFNLNTSAGKFQLRAGDDTLRLTGGNFSHTGSKNRDAKVCTDQTQQNCRPYGQTNDDESRWAGELTTTAKGSNISAEADGYHWRAIWIAPPKQDPHGIAFNMAYMIANNDGIDSCVHVECDQSKGYSDQNEQYESDGRLKSYGWDLWSYLIPRKIMCEAGAVRSVCEAKVYAWILPPSPPLDTKQPGDDNGDGGFGNGAPTLPGEAIVSLLLVAWLATVGRRRNE
ncbi:MAG: hypothetical protein HYT80_11950 [Euryarchaeota archaeon]|nr:hypothetical protein [Euryarchaeota archaeon]